VLVLKKLFSAFLFAIIFGGVIFVSTVDATTKIQGIIVSDTIWAKAKSPYNLTGNLAIEKGVTLTIEPGVTVNLNEYNIRVNGTLTAKGTSLNKIYFNGEADSYIRFTASSTGWNSQTGTGCMIENAVINTRIYASSASILLNNNTIARSIIIGGSSIVSKNTVAIDNPYSDRYGRPADPFEVAIAAQGTAFIVDNHVSGGFTKTAISISGSPTIMRNKISNAYGYGGHPGYGQSGIIISGEGNPIIKQNTITRSANGIHISGSPNPTILYNNIESITSFNLYMGSRTVNIDASNNWWGTTDTEEIERKIWDSDDDFNLGRVNYTPFLTKPDPHAMPDPNAPIPTPNTSPSPSSPTPSNAPSDSQNTITHDQTGSQAISQFGLGWTEVGLFTVAGVIIALLIVNIIYLKRRRTASG
jgi:parallel beta-helix repeat protein